MIYGRALGTLLGDFIVNQYQEQPYPDAIVAVPLSRERLKERGFNQAEVIARYALQEINRHTKHSKKGRPTHTPAKPLKLVHRSLEKVIHTSPQTALSGSERKQPLNHAFQIKSNWHQDIRSIAIIDDVYTTGATLKAISELFRNKGVNEIHLWCVARTV